MFLVTCKYRMTNNFILNVCYLNLTFWHFDGQQNILIVSNKAKNADVHILWTLDCFMLSLKSDYFFNIQQELCVLQGFTIIFFFSLLKWWRLFFLQPGIVAEHLL